MSSTAPGTVDGVGFTGGDILVYDSAADTWSMFFDASDVVPPNLNIDGFHIVDTTQGATIIHMSFSGPTSAPFPIDDSDVVTFTGTTGADTSGSVEMFIDGSSVGLTSGGEDVNALSASGSNWALSILGGGNVPDLGSVRRESLIEFSGTTGVPTSGSFSTLIDLGDVGIMGRRARLYSAWIDPDTNQIYGNNLFNYSINGLEVDRNDIWVYTGTTGADPSGTFSLYFDGDNHRFTWPIDGLHIEPGTLGPPAEADLEIGLTVDPPTAVAGDTVTFDVTVTNLGPDPATNVVVTNALPAGLTFASTIGCTLDPNGLPCSIGDLAAGEGSSIAVSATVDGNVLGTLTNEVEVTSGTVDPNDGNNQASTELLVAGPPMAVTDEPDPGSVPGDPFHAFTDSVYTLAAPGILVNDLLGSPAARLVSFGDGDLGGSVTSYSAGDSAVFAIGSLTVLHDGTLRFTPSGDFEGSFSFEYRLENAGGYSDGKVGILVGPRSVIAGDDLIYVSTAGPGVVDGLAFEDEDILVYDLGVDTWSMHFDGSDVGLGTADINGFTIADNGVILFSLTAPRSIFGLGPTDDSDIISFTPTSTGQNTSGTFALVVDGSDLSLSSGGEDVDAVAQLSGGDLAISTWGSYNLGGGVAGTDEDLIQLNLTGTGPATSGDPAVLFDGSDVGFSAEDIAGASVDDQSGAIYLANLGGFKLPGLSGGGNDIIVFNGSTGPSTSGTFSTFFAGEDARFNSHQIDGLHVARGQRTENRPPTFNGSDSASVDENQNVAVDVEAVDPDGDSEGSGLTFAISGGSDSALFEIKPNTGALTFGPLPDYEAPSDSNGDNVYEVEVEVTDSGGLRASRTYFITVANVSEQATIGDRVWDDLNGNGVQDDGEPGVDGVTVNLIDGNGDPIASAVTAGGGLYGFPVDPGNYTLQFVAPPGKAFTEAGAGSDRTVDSDPDPSTGSVTTTVADDEIDDTVDAGLIDFNAPPEITTTGPIEVDENQTSAVDVDSTDDNDSEAAATLTYSLAGGVDDGLFDIVAATGVVTFKVAPDHEAPGDDGSDNGYDIRVQVVDSGSLIDVVDLTITVANVDENPTITSELSVSVPENQTDAYDIEATDPEGETENGGGLIYGPLAGNDASSFDLDTASGVVTFKVAPDYEAPGDADADGNYEIQVEVQDSAGNSDVAAVVISVIDDGNTAPVISAIIDDTAPENQIGAIDLTATDDADDETGGLTYTKTGGADEARFNLDAATGVLTFAAPPDFENFNDADENNAYEVEVTVSDTEGLTATTLVTITVTDVNEDPSITSPSSATVVENQLTAIDIESSDPEGETEGGGGLTYAITGGADSGLFTIDGGTGVITFNTAPDYEAPGDDDTDNVYVVEVTVTDSGGLSSELSVEITVTNQVEQATIGNFVWDDADADGLQGGSEVGRDGVTVNLIDPTDGTTVLDNVVTADGGSYSFTVDPGQYILEFVAPATTGFSTQGVGSDPAVDSDPDPATGRTAIITVGEDEVDETIDAGIVAVNQPPSIETTGPVSADENQTLAVDLESADDSDSEASSTLTYSFAGGVDDGRFDIDVQTGVVTFTTPPDFESPLDSGRDGQFDIRVTVTDSEGLSDTEDLAIQLVDINEAPIANGDYRGTDNNTPIVAPAAITAETVIGSSGIALGQFETPRDVEVLADGTIVVADSLNDRVQLCDQNGSCTALGTAGSAVGQFDRPEALGRTAAGEILIGETGNERLQVCTTSGDCTVYGDPSDFGTPTGIVETAPGQIVLADPLVFGRVFNCDLTPFACTQYGVPSALASAPGGLALAPNGDIVLTNFQSGRVVICGGPSSCTSFGGPGIAAGSFRSPARVEVTPADGLIVADSINNRIQLCDRSGRCATFGSLGTGLGQFDLPSGIGVTPDGKIVVSEVRNDRLQILDPGGVLVNDHDPENSALSAVAQSITSSEGAAVVIFADGSYTYDPTPSASLQALAGGQSIDDTFSYTLTDGVNSETGTVIVRVRGTNAAPVIDGTPLSPSAAENQTDAIDIETTDDSDDETGGLTYSLSGGADVALFSIDAMTGLVTFNTAPDFERPQDANGDNDYQIQVAVEDSGGLTDVEIATVTVTNEVEQATISNFVWNDSNEDGVQDGGEPGEDGVIVNLIDSADGTTQLDTTTTAGGGLYSFTVDAGNYIVEFVAPNGKTFAAQEAGSDPALDSNPDPTSGRTATITVADDETNDTVDAGLIPAAVGTPPTITPPGPLDVIENETFVVDLEGTDIPDSEGNGLTFSITGGIDEESFFIDSATGELTFSEPPDHEFPGDAGSDNQYVVRITLTDSDGLTDVIELTVTVLDDFEDALVRGFVWDDINTDGLQGGAEPGLDGVVVAIYDTVEGFEWDSTVTADGGYYEFSVPPTSYRIEFTTPAGRQLTSQNVGSDPTIDSDPDPTTGHTPVFTIDEGEIMEYFDAGYFVNP